MYSCITFCVLSVGALFFCIGQSNDEVFTHHNSSLTDVSKSQLIDRLTLHLIELRTNGPVSLLLSLSLSP